MGHKIVLTLGLLLALVFSFSLTTHSWDGLVYSFKDGNHRVPAATQEAFDSSLLQSVSLKTASQRRLLEEASIEKSKYGIGISLGHFTIQGSEGLKGACHIYDKIKMQFRANDMSVNGTPPLLIVESDCLVDNKANKVVTIWIPLSKITHQKPSDMSLKVAEKHPVVSLRMENISDSWPRDWTLTSVRLFNSDMPTQQLDFNRKKSKNFTPVSFTW